MPRKVEQSTILFYVALLPIIGGASLFGLRQYNALQRCNEDRQRLWRYTRWQHEQLNVAYDKLGLPRPSPPATIWDLDKE